MNRVIEFRAWDKQKKKWVYGPTDDNPSSSWVLAAAPFFNNMIVQYTGLKDKHGNKIFEGDVLKCDTGRKVGVEWHDTCAMWDTYFISDEYLQEWKELKNGDWSKRTEIIGNIFENPELLNETVKE